MGIADLFRPKYRHSDVRVRTEAVRALTPDDAAILHQVARTDADIGVRRLAIERIHEAPVLAEIAAAETERSLRDYAGERAAELWQDTACDDDVEAASAALAGIIKLGDQHALVEVAIHGSLPALRKRAFGELRDPRALSELAKGDAPQDLRLAAVGRIDDGDVLRALAIDTTQKEVGLAAVDKLEDTDRLENVAQKAKNKAVRQRARKIVTEMVEAERAKKPGTPDDVKRRRAERAQLLREVEGLADSFDFEKVSDTISTAEVAWMKNGGDGDDGFAEADARFQKAVERFWRRKELHENQARSADELRAVEREAQREKERAAAERAASERAAAAAAAPVEAEDDPKRLAREAEAKARHEERERKRADDDARRAVEVAERDQRRKEDAERGIAIAASLTALCTDLETLDTKDMRQIDRLLQQAAKAFEQVTKVPFEERELLADRYAAARGRLVVRANELREAEDWERFQNVPKAEALIATAKAMATEEPSQDLANRLRQLQALWKEVGAMPQRRSKELWEQFKAICDQIYDKVKGLRAIESEKFVEVTKVKEALIAEAEALAESTDWAATADKLKALQATWKDSGHLPRKQGDELWKRFRAACDTFFERRKPELDARHAEENENLAKKQALIDRARLVAETAPGDGGWGKAIGSIKDLQREWKDIGYVPRRDADAVYAGFRAACDALFAKRDAARDSEANAHRAELDAIKTELDAVTAAADVARAIAVRAKVRELDRRDLSAAVDAMIRAVIAAAPDAVKGTELDPIAARNRRDKLIAKADELLPKAAPAAAEPVDIAAQLKQAMRSNAFGDLRFSGRDPIEVVDELRAQWADAGPVLDDADRAQVARFDDACRKAVDAAGGAHGDDHEDGGPRDETRRRRRDRREDAPAAAQAVAAPEAPKPMAKPVAVTPPPVASKPVAAKPVAPAPVAPTPAAPPPAAPPPAAPPPVAATPVTRVATTPASTPVAPKPVAPTPAAPPAVAATPATPVATTPSTPVAPKPVATSPTPLAPQVAATPATAPIATKPVAPAPTPAAPLAAATPATSPPLAKPAPATPTPVPTPIAAKPVATPMAIPSLAPKPATPMAIPSVAKPAAALSPETPTTPAAASAPARPTPIPSLRPTPAVPAAPRPVAAAPIETHDQPTAPAQVPFEPLPAPPVPPVRTKAPSVPPPPDELDGGWDLGDDPSAKPEKAELQNPPSSSEMAGDSATGGDGIDEPGWD